MSMSELQDVRFWLNELGEPFARALAVFLRECRNARGMRDPEASLRLLRVLGDLQTSEDLDPSLRARLDECVDADEAAAAEGTLEMVEFTSDSPAQAAGKRLRRVLRDRGISQKQLAKMLNVTPSVVSRVLKGPDRSKVATLRRMAAALGVELREIV